MTQHLRLRTIVAAAGLGLFTFALPALKATDTFINIKDYGALANGSHNDGPTILSVINNNVNSTIRFPAGDYYLDNSAGYLIITNFNGTLSFDPHARLVCGSTSHGCIEISGGNGARVENLRITYSTNPASRLLEDVIFISQTTDILVEGPVVERSTAAGMRTDQSIRPTITHATVLSSLADGIHFSNCQDPKVSDSTTNNTGDDGVAFVNYASSAAYSGGEANNITVRNSQARGISVVGQSDVIVSNFLIDTTSSSGVLCAYDASYSTRVPDRVRFSNGIIKNAGTLAPKGGNQYGVEFSGAASCEFANLAIYNSADRSFSGSNPTGQVKATNVYTNGGSVGFNIGPTLLAVLTDITAEAPTGYGIFIATQGTALLDNARAVNASTSGGLNRAVWFENNARVLSHGVSVIDTQGAATGFIVGEYNNTNGVSTGIQSQIAHGALAVQQNSTHFLFRREDAP